MSIEEHNERQLLASMGRLHENPDFERFTEFYLRKLLKDYTQTCIDAEHPAVAQGGARALQKILDEVEGATEAFYRINKRDIPLS